MKAHPAHSEDFNGHWTGTSNCGDESNPIQTVVSKELGDGEPQAVAAYIPGLEHCFCKPRIFDASDGAAAFFKRQTQKTSFRASQI